MYKIDFSKPIHIHFIGIGGISMSGLAEILHEEGFTISGSDSKESDLTKTLAAKGIKVIYGQSADNITSGIDLVVYTAAIHESNPEFAAAKAAGIPMLTRAELLGQIMDNYDYSIAVAGTHGKTTTTSMISEILLAAQTDPTISVGGILSSIHGNLRVGDSEYFISEACEYTNSFLNFRPRYSIILNIEAEHLDFFKDLEAVKASFCTFAAQVPPDGHIVANFDDQNTLDALKPLGRPLFTFGLTDKANVYAKNIERRGAQTEFDAFYNGELFTHISLRVPGLHNVQNALAATAAAICLGIDPTSVSYGLAGFTGAGRRFEFKGKFNGADVYDDYAHHPGELKALLDAVEPLGYKRIITVFQPHTYSRTKALFDDFAEQLRRPNLTYLAEIYAAREQNTLGISSADLARAIPGAVYLGSFEALEKNLRETAAPGDIIMTVGAGDVYKLGEKLVHN